MGTKKPVTKEQNASEAKGPQGFPIVGIGASAGGLEAFKMLLEFLPIDTGLAFVIIQHLSTGQESMLTDILSRFTKMQVLQVEDNMPVEPNRVYVIPPGQTMTLVDGLLNLNPKGKSLRPINDFLNSLAVEQKTKAIGIVLSGTGTDGTEGLKGVKAEGGITFAQAPNSAQYPGMPQSAILADAVDFVLSPDLIAGELAKIAKNPQLVLAEIEAQEPRTKKETGLQRIFTLLKSSFNVDFSHYKDAVVNRRVTRRMVINHLDSITKYAEFVETHPAELQALFNDMLIGVTSFFRESNTFQLLKEKLFPEILKKHSSKEPIRIWIPGCSTGEEAYSFAIALQEFLEETAITDIQVQIFGTDVNEKNIDKARQGIYLKSIDAHVSENRLTRFFSSFNGNYQIAKFIRDMCVFAKQDITADPPFSNLDLISCRNMLIYFDSRLQERIVPILHYALKPNGFLVLGESESIGKFTMLFEPVNKKSFIYTKKKAQPNVNFGFGSSVFQAGKVAFKEPAKKDSISLLREEVDQLLITEHVPAAFLINSSLDILVFRGNVTPYLSPESGQTSLNVAKIIRKELRAEVQSLVYRAKKENQPIMEEAVRLRYNKQQKTVNIQVMPLGAKQYDEPFFLVLIEDVSAAAALLSQTIALSTTPEGRENVKDSQILELKEELASSKQSLQSVIETQEVTNEELRSAMEEVQSSNEELQSTNEELETAKEELQSSNEELTTLNDELKNRNQTLGRLSNNQANLTRNVDPAVVMVDSNLKISLFTPSAQKILNLVPSDTGLPLSNVRLAISVPDLEKTIIEVIKTREAVNKEVRDETGRFYEMRVRPYITEDNKTDGAVISFIDINVLRQHENKLQIEETKYRTLAENSPDIIARLDRNLRYLYINSAVKQMTRVSPNDVVGKTNEEIGLPKKLADALNEVLQNTMQTGKVEKGELEFPSPNWTRIYQYVIVPEFSVEGAVETVLALFKDISERKKIEEDLRRQAALIDLSPDAIIVKTPGDIITLWSEGAEKLYGWTKKEAMGQKTKDLLSPQYPESLKRINNELKRTGRWSGEVVHRAKNGCIVTIQSWWLVRNNEYGRIVEILESNVDITERKRAEDKIRFEAERLKTVMENSLDLTMLTKTDGTILFVNSALKRITGYDKEEFIEKNPWIVHPEDSNKAKDVFSLVLKGELVEFEHRIITKDGQIRWVIHSSAPVAKEGKVAEIISTIRDITKRKKTEVEREIMVEFLKIANSPAISDDLVKAATDFIQKQSGCEAVGIRLKEGDDYPYYVTRGFPPEHVKLENKLCARDEAGCLIGDSKGEPILECMCGNILCGRFDPTKEFFTEQGSFWTNSTTQLLATTTEADRQANARNRCNSEGYESVALIPLTVGDTRLGLLQLNDKRKNMFGLEAIQMWEKIANRLAVALSRAIAEEALGKSELRYREISEHLETLVEERTKQLRDSERLAAIGTVAGMVGHDIRNPLQAIVSDIYLAKTDLTSMPTGEEKENLQESIEEIEKNISYISNIVADLQNFSQPVTLKIEETDLKKIVDSALATLYIPENITATSCVKRDFPKIKVDPTYLQRILVNLSNNAIQAMPRGGRLTISTSTENGKVTITIQDTGEGIPEHVKSKIFTPLLTTKAKGQGFGLTAVKRFTEAMGGTVSFETETGKGTKFIIELPI